MLRHLSSHFCQIPFLQPFHGYPHHYFNMTQAGVRTLFEEGMDVERVEVLRSGHPIALLSWFLGEYARGLPPELHETFSRLTVKDLLKPASALLSEDFAVHLTEEARRGLACCNYMIARKL